MGQPERIPTLPYHEIGGTATLSLRENGVGGPVPRDCVKLLDVHFSCCDALNN